MWPYGTIAMIEELFGAESKGQVYGAIHSIFAKNTESLSVIGEFICMFIGPCTCVFA